MNDAIKNQFVYLFSKQKQLFANDWLMFEVNSEHGIEMHSNAVFNWKSEDETTINRTLIMIKTLSAENI